MRVQRSVLGFVAVSLLMLVPCSIAALDAAPTGGLAMEDSAPATDARARLLRDYPKPAESATYYAYEAEATQPIWAGAGGPAGLVRDDDLATAWSCAGLGAASRCAVALQLPSEAAVHMVRIAITASPSPGSKAPADIPLRIHTGQGWLDARLTRTLDHQHVMIEQGIKTRTLVLELLPVEQGEALGIAEVDLFGPTGPRRAPLALDPRRVVVRTNGRFYRQGANGYAEAKTAWLEQIVDLSGAPRRLLQGSNLFMQPGDRLALVRQLGSANCPGAEVHEGGELLVIDTVTRLMVRFASFESHQHAYRRNDGMGVVVELVSGDGQQTITKAYAIDGKGTPTTRMPPASALSADLSTRGRRRDSYADFPKVTTRACREPTEAERDRVRRTGVFAAEHGERTSLLCKDADGNRVSVIGEKCDDHPWIVVAFDKAWRRSPGARLTGDFAEIRELDGRLLVGMVTGDSADIHVLEPDGKLRLLLRNAAFEVHIPSTCRCSA
jgi:hypothetical protein